MKARGLGTLMGFAVTGVLSVVTMRSCQPSATSSPSNPLSLAEHATAGTCADNRSVAEAGSPDDAVPAVTLPGDLAAKLRAVDPAAAAILAQAATCTTSTTSPSRP